MLYLCHYHIYRKYFSAIHKNIMTKNKHPMLNDPFPSSYYYSFVYLISPLPLY